MTKIDGREFPEYLYYHKDHMWVNIEKDKARVGYNDWAQNASGKLLSINTRKQGRTVKQGKTLGTVESGKWVGPLKAPLTGEILELNQDTIKDPSSVNQDPYGKGWIALLAPQNLDELSDLIKGTDTDSLQAWITEEKKRAT